MSSIDWSEGGPTEERAYEVLRLVFDAAEQRDGRHGHPGWLTPHPRSPLADDDRALHPWAVSHTAVQAIVSGNDHLMTLSHLLGGPGGRFPAYAAFTIARAAIEAGAIALWAVGPDDPVERRTNVVRWELKNKRDMVEFGGRIGRTDEERAEDLKQATKRLHALADQLAIPRGRRKERLTTTAMLTAPHIPKGELPAVAAWSAASSFAHGSSWSTLLLQQVAWLPSVKAGEARATITADARILAWFTLTAHELIAQAEHLMTRRGAAPKPARSAMKIVLHQSPAAQQPGPQNPG